MANGSGIVLLNSPRGVQHPAMDAERDLLCVDHLLTLFLRHDLGCDHVRKVEGCWEGDGDGLQENLSFLKTGLKWHALVHSE